MSKTTGGRSEAAQKRHEMRRSIYRQEPGQNALSAMHRVASAFGKPPVKWDDNNLTASDLQDAIDSEEN
jgi:hypothetical protein